MDDGKMMMIYQYVFNKKLKSLGFLGTVVIGDGTWRDSVVFLMNGVVPGRGRVTNTQGAAS